MVACLLLLIMHSSTDCRNLFTVSAPSSFLAVNNDRQCWHSSDFSINRGWLLFIEQLLLSIDSWVLCVIRTSSSKVVSDALSLALQQKLNSSKSFNLWSLLCCVVIDASLIVTAGLLGPIASHLERNNVHCLSLIWLNALSYLMPCYWSEMSWTCFTQITEPTYWGTLFENHAYHISMVKFTQSYIHIRKPLCWVTWDALCKPCVCPLWGHNCFSHPLSAKVTFCH